MTPSQPKLHRHDRAGAARTTELLQSLSGLPDISGAITKTYEFKLRIVFPLDAHTQGLLDARGGSFEQHTFFRSLASKLRPDIVGTPMTVVGLTVRERSSKLFKTSDAEPAVTALLLVVLSYSAHRVYTGAEMRTSLRMKFDDSRYADSVELTMFPNR